IYCAGGEVTTTQLTGAFRGVEAYDPASNTWSTLPSMPMPRHGVAGAVIGNEFHLVSGMVQSAGSMAFLDPKLATHTAAHDVLNLQFAAPPIVGKSDAAAPSATGNSDAATPLTTAKGEGTASSAGPKKSYTRYNVNSSEGQLMLAKYARAIDIMRTLPDYDTRSWT